jgi:uncharacterized Zn-binding protein involved in type VI secretion
MDTVISKCCVALVIIVGSVGAAQAQAPAARQGDATSHGGMVITGTPTVLIGGQPAARVADMAVCPAVMPGPSPVPHVGGPIITGSATVLIGGMPAARAGSVITETGATSTITAGAPTVLIGN